LHRKHVNSAFRREEELSLEPQGCESRLATCTELLRNVVEHVKLSVFLGTGRLLLDFSLFCASFAGSIIEPSTLSFSSAAILTLSLNRELALDDREQLETLEGPAAELDCGG